MTAANGGFTGIELNDERYTVEQSLFRSRYTVTDTDGNVVLKAKKKRLSIKDRFPFQDADGNDVFEVASASAFDFDRSRDYVVIDAETDEEVVVLDERFSFASHKWSIRDPETSEVIVTIESQSKLAFAARDRLGIIGKLLPYKYDIKTADGTSIGTIGGQLSLNDVYEVEVRNDYDGPREAIVATAMIIDAIEGN